MVKISTVTARYSPVSPNAGPNARYHPVASGPRAGLLADQYRRYGMVLQTLHASMIDMLKHGSNVFFLLKSYC